MPEKCRYLLGCGRQVRIPRCELSQNGRGEGQPGWYLPPIAGALMP